MKRGALLALLALAACASEPAAIDDRAAAPANAAGPAAEAPADSGSAAEAPANRGAAAAPATPALAIEGEGLRLFNRATGSARPIPFGTAQPRVIAALAALGTPDINRLEECRLDAASWPNGPSLYFHDGKFVGWAVSGPGRDTVTTAAGIGPGSTRAELESSYAARVFESTLGTEFAAGNLFGILDGKGAKAKVTNMWAGTSCNMR